MLHNPIPVPRVKTPREYRLANRILPHTRYAVRPQAGKHGNFHESAETKHSFNNSVGFLGKIT